jgi:hypothetical protein
MMMYQAGVSELVYDEEYRLTDGIEFLKRKLIKVEKYDENPD